jgi:MFS family permease
MATLTARQRLSFAPTQRKVLFALASVVGLRMLGLFLVLPVFTLYGLQFTSSRFLVGFAFGSYGLTMAILQVPFGRLSDRIGRRKVLMLGMTLFSLGSFVCAVPHWFPPPLSITALIVGRLVQGGGAIVSVAFATVADYIEPERRSTAMAVLGIPIGAAFALGVIGGPVLAGLFGTAFLFWLTGFLGLGTDYLLVRYLGDEPCLGRQAPQASPVPAPYQPPESAFSPQPERLGTGPASLGSPPHGRVTTGARYGASTPAPLSEVLGNRPLLAFAAGGFLMNFFMASFFFHFPLIVTGQHHIKVTHYYAILLPMMIISGVTMFGFSQGADRGWGRPLAAFAYLIFLPSSLLLFEPAAAGLNPNRLAPVLIAGTLFYIGFTGLEPILPSLVSKAAPESAYGTALGLYNTSQFLGSFAGGAVAGALSHFSPAHTLGTLTVASLAGFVLMLASPSPRSPGRNSG